MACRLDDLMLRQLRLSESMGGGAFYRKSQGATTAWKKK